MPSPNGDASSGDADLDALIGRLEQEAARRRAEPSFPVDDEARLSIEMDRQAPDAPGSRLDRLADSAIRHVRSTDGAPGSVSSGRGRGAPAGGRGAPAGGRGAPAGGRGELAGLVGRASRMLAAGDTNRLAERLDLLASIVSGGLRTASIQLAGLDRRLGRIEAGGGGPGAAPVQAPNQAAIPELAVWMERVAADLGSGPGRVLCYGVDSPQWVAGLRAGSVDAYDMEAADALAPDSSPDGGDVGELAAHLGAVPDDSLAAVVLAGMIVRADPPAFRRLVARLAGAARAVIVVSEAPWWWNKRLGTETADLAPRRPPTPETWLQALTGAGFTATAVYSPDGRTFCAVGHR